MSEYIGKRELVFIVLMMAIPLGTWWFVFRPSSARQAEMLQQIEAKQAKLQELNRTTAMIGDLRKEIGELDQAITFFQSKLPSEKEIDKVLHEVSRLAEQSDLTALSIRTMDRVAEGVFTTSTSAHAEQPISMKLQGDFMGLYTFMLAIENQPRIMRVRQMKIQRPNNTPEGFMEADVVMSIFFEKDKG